MSGAAIVNTPVTLTLTPQNSHTLQKAAILVDGAFEYLGQEPFSLELRLDKLGQHRLAFFILLENNQYILKEYVLPVSLNVPIKHIAVESNELFLFAGSSYQLSVEAYSDGIQGLPADITELATYTVTAGANVVKLGEPGVIEALTLGQAKVAITYGGQRQDITIKVIAVPKSASLFKDSFE